MSNNKPGKTIHIVPVGSSEPVDSYLIPFNNYPPSKVIFLLGKDQTRPDEIKAREITKEICSQLPKWVEHEIKETDIFEFTKIMKAFYEIIKNERESDKDCDIYINSASSTSIVTIASYTAASIMSAGIYYMKLKDFRSEKTDAEKLIVVPIMQIKPPKESHIEVMNKINEAGDFGSIKDLVNEGLKLDYNKGGIRNKYSKIVKELEDSGFVKTEKPGRVRKKIKLTESGKIMSDISFMFEKSE